MDSERRRAPRYPFIAEAEVTEISSDTKLAAKTSDLSVGGCFLDMLNPTPEGTAVRVRISHEGATFTALGRVAFNQCHHRMVEKRPLITKPRNALAVRTPILLLVGGALLSWVREDIPNPSDARGIIVCQQVSERLKAGAKLISGLSLTKFNISFWIENAE